MRNRYLRCTSAPGQGVLVDAQDARLADVAAPPGTPQSPPARLGKDKEPWDVLLVEERAAAEKLGWTPESWEQGPWIWDEEAAASDVELTAMTA